MRRISGSGVSSINGPPFILSVTQGDLKGQRLTVENKLRLGREADNDVVLNDAKVSRYHGTLRVMGDRLFYRDEGSTNGSELNGSPVHEAELKLGDCLRLGQTEMAVVEEDDFRTIHFVMSESTVTGSVEASAIQPDALAQKFADIFEYYKENQPEQSEAERYELVRTQRMVNGLRSLYAVSQSMTRILSVPALLESISANLFELYSGAENLAILLQNTERGRFEVRHARNRDSDEEPEMSISKTVLDEAVNRRSTLIANDTGANELLAASQSIIGSRIKSVMCAPMVSGDRVLGVLYLDNRTSTASYDEMDAELVTAFANQCAVALDNASLCETLQSHYHQTLQSLVNAIEAKDSYTMGHTARVAKYSLGIARYMGLSEERCERLKMAADLHDIGKIGVSEGIINKADRLSDTEYVTIKDHVEMGEKILQPITFLRDLLPWIRAHHEKWDGSGYPDGAMGEDIPLEGRILALADAFDAMTSQRSYNEPMKYEQALQRVESESGSAFDPDVVTAFGQYVRQELVQQDMQGLSPSTAPLSHRQNAEPQEPSVAADPSTQ